MTELSKWINEALQIGFTDAGELNMESLQFLEEVRQMCAGGKCHIYGKCWSCPPYCDGLDEIRNKIAGYQEGILVQTTGLMEDDFDYETMMETERKHKAMFAELVGRMRKSGQEILPMGAGCCSICETCSCPDSPCRFPELMISSMEAYGLLVNDVVKASGMKYNHGPHTITFSSCILM